jgi:hypothetical protein
MAGRAIVHNAGVINGGRDKITGGMAGTAILTGHEMISVFRRGETGVMTCSAVVHDADMIKRRRFKARGYVTVAAVSVGRYMVIVLACGRIAIVTGRAIIHTALVIEFGTRKGCGRMAHRAILGGWNMRAIGLGIFTNRRTTIVA